MKLYNTLTRELAVLEPTEITKMYTCGITPYDTTHLGHAFTYSVSDILIRTLENRGQRVVYVQNVTDIDDDILRKAEKEGQDWLALGNRWTRHYIDDMKSLNIRPPDYYPRATDVIPQMVEIIAELLEQGVAYESGGNVYYEVDSWQPFGQLSHLPKGEMLPIANERGNFPDDPHKRAPLDFVLWQAEKPGEPSWESPWGKGRPGWHIECSTMATNLLGDTIDIHSGGGDLLFPHHECEIAQVEPLNDQKPFVRFWLHVAMVYHEGEKMSKSLGNLVWIRDLLKDYTADALRIYMGMHHYRESWSHNFRELNQASVLDYEIRRSLAMDNGKDGKMDPTYYHETFHQALDNDLDTPTALETVQEMVQAIINEGNAGKDISRAQLVLRSFGEVFGLRMDNAKPDPRVTQGWDQHLARFT